MTTWRPGRGLTVMLAVAAVLAGLVVAMSASGWRVYALGGNDLLLSQPHAVTGLTDDDLDRYAVVWAPMHLEVPVEGDIVCDDDVRDVATDQVLCVHPGSASWLTALTSSGGEVVLQPVAGTLDPWRVERGSIGEPLRAAGDATAEPGDVELVAERAYHIPPGVALAAPGLAALAVVVAGIVAAAPARRRGVVGAAALAVAAVVVLLPSVGVAELTPAHQVRLPEIIALRHAPALILVGGLLTLLVAAPRRTQVAVVSILLLTVGAGAAGLDALDRQPSWQVSTVVGSGSMRPSVDAGDTVIYRAQPLAVGDVAVRGHVLHRVVGQVDVAAVPVTTPWEPQWPASIRIPMGQLTVADETELESLGLRPQVATGTVAPAAFPVYRGDANGPADPLLASDGGVPRLGDDAEVVRAVIPLGEVWLRPVSPTLMVALGLLLPMLYGAGRSASRRFGAARALAAHTARTRPGAW